MNNKPIKQFFGELNKQTDGRNLYDITSDVESWIRNYDILNGLLTLQILHTSASLLINENYDSDVLVDLNSFFDRLVPDGDQLFIHTAEGKDDMPAHIRSALTQTHLSIPVRNNHIALGVWQGIYLFEHRLYPHTRNILMHLLGE